MTEEAKTNSADSGGKKKMSRRAFEKLLTSGSEKTVR
jgi:hypothetical protein